MSKSYLPTSDLEKVTWLNNFKSKIMLHGSSLGFTQAEITSIQNDAAMFQYIVQLKEGSRQSLQSLATLTKDLKTSTAQTAMGALPVLPVAGTPPAAVLNGIFSRIAVYVKRIRMHSNYTETLAVEMGIAVSEDVFDPAAAKPYISGRVEAGYPRLKWTKSQADGVYLYVDRRDGNGFVLIDKLVRTEFIDTAALPSGTYSATWDYKVRYMIDDDEIGLDSNIVSLNVVRV